MNNVISLNGNPSPVTENNNGNDDYWISNDNVRFVGYNAGVYNVDDCEQNIISNLLPAEHLERKYHFGVIKF